MGRAPQGWWAIIGADDIPIHLLDNLPSSVRSYFSFSLETEHSATSPVHDSVSEIEIEYNAGEEAELCDSSECSIQVYDMLADLRADGIVANLGQSDCAYCGRNAGKELVNNLIDDGEWGKGCAGIDATSLLTAPELIVQGFGSGDLTDADLVLRAYESARKHGIRSDLTVMKAGQSHDVDQ